MNVKQPVYLYLLKNWKVARLIGYFFLATAIFASWLSCEFRPFWNFLDLNVFLILNKALSLNIALQWIGGLLSTRLSDLFFDLVLLIIAIVYVKQQERGQRLQGAATIVFMLIYIWLVMEFVNRVCDHFGSYHFRLSPTLTLPNTYRLSQAFPTLPIKDHSPCSFPADHALSFLLFAALSTCFFSKKFSRLIWIIAIIFCLPRLASGAHWFTDQFIGSGMIAMIATSVAINTPISTIAITALTQLFQKIGRIFK